MVAGAAVEVEYSTDGWLFLAAAPNPHAPPSRHPRRWGLVPATYVEVAADPAGAVPPERAPSEGEGSQG